MKDVETKCLRKCRNTCASLNEALRIEASSIRFYEGVQKECNIPEVKSFINEIIDERRKGIVRIIQKLNEIHAKSQISDGIISSFNQFE